MRTEGGGDALRVEMGFAWTFLEQQNEIKSFSFVLFWVLLCHSRLHANMYHKLKYSQKKSILTSTLQFNSLEFFQLFPSDVR